uniref:ARAD1C18986p n=1 Tax=Blastobotrys adeninivorans TaxID=409370 RepID=A0A060T0W8_BLAAD
MSDSKPVVDAPEGAHVAVEGVGHEEFDLSKKRGRARTSSITGDDRTPQQRIVWGKREKPLALLQFAHGHLPKFAENDRWTKVDFYKYLAAALRDELPTNIPRNADGTTLTFIQIRSKLESMLGLQDGASDALDQSDDVLHKELVEFRNSYFALLEDRENRRAEYRDRKRVRTSFRFDDDDSDRMGSVEDKVKELSYTVKATNDSLASISANVASLASLASNSSDIDNRLESLERTVGQLKDYIMGMKESMDSLVQAQNGNGAVGVENADNGNTGDNL